LTHQFPGLGPATPRPKAPTAGAPQPCSLVPLAAPGQPSVGRPALMWLQTHPHSALSAPPPSSSRRCQGPRRSHWSPGWAQAKEQALEKSCASLSTLAPGQEGRGMWYPPPHLGPADGDLRTPATHHRHSQFQAQCAPADDQGQDPQQADPWGKGGRSAAPGLGGGDMPHTKLQTRVPGPRTHLGDLACRGCGCPCGMVLAMAWTDAAPCRGGAQRWERQAGGIGLKTSWLWGLTLPAPSSLLRILSSVDHSHCFHSGSVAFM
jgi:hypothetical protein